MDKTSREYAEKLAVKDAEYLADREDKEFFIKHYPSIYLTAIEETNAKGKDEVINTLLEALEMADGMLNHSTGNLFLTGQNRN